MMKAKGIRGKIVDFFKTKKIIKHTEKKSETIEILTQKTKSLLNTLIFEKDITNKLIKTALEKIIYPRGLKEHTNILENQRQILIDYIISTANTKIGEYYNFENILIDNIDLNDNTSIYQNFKNNIPISEYNQFKSWIELSKKQKNIIRPGQINKFSASAGTTAINQENGNKKTIPVTYESMKSLQKAGQEMLAEYVAKYPDTDIFKGHTLPLVGSIQNISKNKIITGDVSALILLERSNITKTKYAFNVQSLIEPNRNKKRELFGKQLDPYKKLMMIGVTSWADNLLNYREKKHEKKYKTLIQNQNMEVIIGGGVDVAPYIDKFNKLGIRYLGNYNASEGVFGYQNIVKYDNSKGKAPYKLLGNHGIFYEFIEFNSNNFNETGELKSTAKAKQLSELIFDKNKQQKLAVVITTNSGLLRYLIGDVIEFVDDDFNFNIVGRTRQCLNLKGEELMETHISFVINQIRKKYGIQIKNYTVGPDNENNPQKHQRIIELEKPQDITNTEKLTKNIDILLQKINPDYKAKRRDNILLKIPDIIFTEQSDQIFYKRLNLKGKLGGQSKIPKLSHNRKILKEILKIIK